MANKTTNTATGTVGTSPVVTALAENAQRRRLWMYADSTNTGIVLIRWDGTDPTTTVYHAQLVAGAGLLLDQHVPSGSVLVVGSAASQRYTIEEG